MCGLLVATVGAGEDGLALPGGNVLRAGSDDFVLSNYSFQNGTTYFLDLDGNGVRSIVEVQRLSDIGTIQVVVHRATREQMAKHRLVSLPGP
jgi:hypothetical protein